MIIAHHIILTGYGHWLPNDPRGSLSREIRKDTLAELGEIHYGRKANQPSRQELRTFHKQAKSRLQFPLLWFEAQFVRVIGEALGQVVRDRRLTCYACGVLRNHAHLVIRRHRRKAQEMIPAFWSVSREALQAAGLAAGDHPVWSRDPYVAYKNDPRAVRAAIGYIQRNFTKHRVASQTWDFVVPYDGWPHPRTPAP